MLKIKFASKNQKLRIYIKQWKNGIWQFSIICGDPDEKGPLWHNWIYLYVKIPC